MRNPLHAASHAIGKYLLVMAALVLHVLLPGCASAQVKQKKKPEEITKQAARINALLQSYDRLSPFEGGDDRYERIGEMNSEIVSRLLVLLNDQRMAKHDPEQLLKGEELIVSRSADCNIYFFSVDEKTGGSYRTSKTLIYYRLPGGKVKARLFGDDEPEALTTAVYGPVYLLDSAAHRYVALGSVQTCNTCIAAVAVTLQLDSGLTGPQLVTQYDGRHANLQKFEYNEQARELTVMYEDAGADDPLYGSSSDEPVVKRTHKARFAYLHGAFVEIERCEYLLRED